MCISTTGMTMMYVVKVRSFSIVTRKVTAVYSGWKREQRKTSPVETWESAITRTAIFVA